MSGDIYQKLEMDFRENVSQAHDVIKTLEIETKGLVGNHQIRAIIYEAKGDLGQLEQLANNFKYNEIIEKYSDIDFSKTFHELKLSYAS